MVLGDVERLEVVPVILDLRTLGHAVAEAEEQPNDLVLYDRQGVQRPVGPAPPGEGHVHGVRCQQRGLHIDGERVPACLKRVRQFGAGLVDGPPQLASLPFLERAQSALHLAERRLASEHRDVRRFEFLERSSRREQLATARTFRLQGAEHLGCLHRSAESTGRSEAARPTHQRGSGSSTWNDNVSPETSDHARPPCVSATARAT